MAQTRFLWTLGWPLFERAGDCAEGEMTDLWRPDLRDDAVPERIVRDARNPASTLLRD